jgi:hypothetical protein
MEDGCNEVGLELLRNAVVAGSRNEDDENRGPLGPMADSIKALFLTNGIDGGIACAALSRCREGAKEKSRHGARVRCVELLSLQYLVELHKVPCILILCGEFMHNCHSIFTKANTAFATDSTPWNVPAHLLVFKQMTTHTLLELCALSRHV